MNSNSATVRLLLVCTVLVLASAALPQRSFLERDSVLPIRPGWSEHSRESPTAIVKLIFAVKRENMPQLEAIFNKVSNPDHADYRKYLSPAEARKLIRPDPKRLAAVLNHLTASRLVIDATSKDGAFVMAHGLVRDVEAMFSVKVFKYTHDITGKTISITRDPMSLPADIAGHLDFVAGMSRFPKIKLNQAQRMQAYFKNTGQGEGHKKAGITAPVVEYVFMGDEQLTLFLQPACQDGSTPVTTGANLQCGGIEIDFEINVSQNSVEPRSHQFANGPYIPSSLCKPCSAWTGAPSSVCSNKNLDPSTMYCNVLLGQYPARTSPTIENYLPTSLTVTETYGNATLTSDAYSGSIFPSPWVVPKRIRQLYNIPEGIKGIPGTGNIQSVVEFQGQYYAPSDLQAFETDMGLISTNVTLVGPNDPTQPGGESTLDIEYILAVSPGVDTVFWSVENPNWPDCLVAWAVAMGDADSPPLINSISYGDIESTYSTNVTSRLNTEFQNLATRGLTILVASGDNGVADTNPSNSSNCKPFNPDYPSSSPYVTAVSATQLSTQTSPICSKTINGATTRCDETGEIVSSAATGSVITTGGGFSEAFEQPSYQNGFVSSYLNNPNVALPPSSGYYNPKGRGIPDVAALGHNFVVNQGGTYGRADGTSASTPVFAGVLALLNDILLQKGQKPLGFVNPLLYKMAVDRPSTFNDVTMGNNKCNVYYYPACCEYGFEAAPGWDATTGLGTPNFGEMAEYIRDMAASSESVKVRVVNDSTKIVQK